MKIQHSIGLAGLYFLEGIPHGLQTILIPLMLRQQQYQLSTISLIHLLSLPWLLRCLIAPYFEKNSLKQTKWWIMVCLFLVSISVSVVNGNIATDHYCILIAALLGNSCFSVLLDINVDSLGMSWVTSHREIGTFNIIQVVAYKLGVLFTSAVQSISNSSDIVTFAVVATYMGALGAINMGVINCLFSFTPNEKVNKTKSPQKATNCSLVSILKVEGTLSMMVYCLFYKFGEKGFMSMSKMLLFDQNVNLQKISSIRGVLSQLFSVAGSVVGGFVNQTESLNLTLVVFIRCSIMLIQTAYVTHAVHIRLSLFCLFDAILYFTSGFITTRTFSLMMINCKKSETGHQNTHYAVLTASELFGKLLIETTSGSLVRLYGYGRFLSSCVLIDVFLFLYCVNALSSR